MSGSVEDARLFSHDPLTGITEYFTYDPETDGFTIETRQDVGAMLELAKQYHNDAPLRWGEFTHVKYIPDVIMMELQKQGIVHGYRIVDEPKFRAFLNERDTAAFRTRPGRV
jgi:hypothetical protein